jgi:SAM-dependent methyltransferase
MPSASIKKSVLKIIETLPEWPAIQVLDLSCGEGAILELLQRKGCSAEGTHYRNDDYIVKNPSPVLSEVPIHDSVDLTQHLPFSDKSYDVVIATEVIEHLPSHAGFLAEAARITKDGGSLIITTPNINRLQSRIQFALTGQHEFRSARLGWDIPADAIYSTHHNPVYFPVIHTLLHHNGMRIVHTRFTKCSLAALLLIPLLPLIWLATVIEARHAIKRSRTGGINLLRWMLDIRLLFSDILLIQAKKIA